MISVILSAGKSSRFLEEGFSHQKSMLQMPDGRKMLEWQVAELRSNSRKVIYISRERYRDAETATVKKLRMKYMGFFENFWLSKPTSGPLDGLWAARHLLRTDEELLIVYNDEIVLASEVSTMVEKARKQCYSAALVAFDTPNTRFTTVPNTNLACGCTYYFSSGKDFLKKAKRLPKGPENGVPDVVYSFRNWLHHKVPESRIIEIGTAEEYKRWMAEQGSPVINTYDDKCE